jgi:hypothetical protein
MNFIVVSSHPAPYPFREPLVISEQMDFVRRHILQQHSPGGGKSLQGVRRSPKSSIGAL